MSKAAREKQTYTVWMTQLKVSVGRNLHVRVQRKVFISVAWRIVEVS